MKPRVFHFYYSAVSRRGGAGGSPGARPSCLAPTRPSKIPSPTATLATPRAIPLCTLGAPVFGILRGHIYNDVGHGLGGFQLMISDSGCEVSLGAGSTAVSFYFVVIFLSFWIYFIYI